MIKQLASRLDWRIWVVFVVLGAVIEPFSWATVPHFQYYYHDNIFYPWLILSNSLLFHAMIISLNIFLFIGLSYSFREKHRRMGIPITGMLLFMSMAVCCSTALPFRPALSHKTSISFKDHLYHLALSLGPNTDWDYTLAVYIVYQCDSTGFICHLHYCPFYESIQTKEEENYALKAQTAFIADNDELYVQIGSEKSKVRPMCQYGGGYYR